MGFLLAKAHMENAGEARIPMPMLTENIPSVKMLNKTPEARSWIPRYGTLKNRATITVRIRMVKE